MENIDDILKVLKVVLDTKPKPRMGFSTFDADEEWQVECEIQGRTALPAPLFQIASTTNSFSTLINFVKMLEKGGLLKDAKTVIDAGTIEALELLRAHFHTPDLSAVKKFEGVRKEGVSALEFYDTHYASLKEAMNGRLLSQYDSKLYAGLKSELQRAGRSISEVIPSYESVLDERRKAAATLLQVGSSEIHEDQLYNFFTTIRRR